MGGPALRSNRRGHYVRGEVAFVLRPTYSFPVEWVWGFWYVDNSSIGTPEYGVLENLMDVGVKMDRIPFEKIGYNGEHCCSVNVLGTEYAVIFLPFIGNERVAKILGGDKYVQTASGMSNANNKMIYIATDGDDFKSIQDDEEAIIFSLKSTLRHELIHVFLRESGLGPSSLAYNYGWADNEEMVDWFARMAPKICGVFYRLGCL